MLNLPSSRSKTTGRLTCIFARQLTHVKRRLLQLGCDDCGTVSLAFVGTRPSNSALRLSKTIALENSSEVEDDEVGDPFLPPCGERYGVCPGLDGELRVGTTEAEAEAEQVV